VLTRQLTSEKERSVAQMRDERERAERDQHAALAEAVKGQATLRAEMAAMLQRVKVRTVFVVCLLFHIYSVIYAMRCDEMWKQSPLETCLPTKHD
jgi:hypothetical protein